VPPAALRPTVAAALLAAAGAAMAIETPRHEVVERRDGYEIRAYAPRLVAETEVEAPRADAGNEGFRRLAGFIFGKNDGGRKVAMTAPVTQAEGARIAMTAPVALAPAAPAGPDGAAPAGEGGPTRYVVQFTMPSDLSLDTAPRPLDARVTLREVPARRVAVLAYSGTWSTERYAEREARLLAALARDGLTPAGPAEWARYDPPWMPWFLRTNEVQVPLADGDAGRAPQAPPEAAP
jgi:hypothetical protein